MNKVSILSSYMDQITPADWATGDTNGLHWWAVQTARKDDHQVTWSQIGEGDQGWKAVLPDGSWATALYWGDD